MAIHTLRPNSTISAGAWTPSFGTLHGDTSDDSDATAAELDQFSGSSMELGLTTHVLAAGDRVALIRLRVRTRRTSGSPAPLLRVSSSLPSEMVEPLLNTSMATYASAWADPGSLTQNAIDDARITALGLGAGTSNILVAELYVDLDVWERTDTPTVTTNPAGAGGPPPVITDTDQPTVESYVAALNDGTPGQWSRQVKVVRSAVYAGHATDDDITAETDVEWEDLDTAFGTPSTASGAPDTIQVDTPLANSDSYKVYVRYGKNAVAGETLWSEWGEYEFELDLALPTAPTVGVTVDQPNGRNTIEVTTAALTHDTLESLRVQRTDDAGITWRTIRGGFLDDITPSTPYTFQDYDAPRGVDVQYRARVVEGLTVSGTTIASDWMTSPVDEHPNDERWWLYPVGQFDDTLDGARIRVDPEIQVEQEQGVFRPLGRRTAVVVSGVLHGDDGAYELKGTGPDECDAVGIIARYTGTVLVKDPWGDQKYVVWTSRSRSLLGVPSEPRHTWTLAYVEVDDGIGGNG